MPIDTSNPNAFDVTLVQPLHGNCPHCGQSSFGHITINVGPQLGRRCLECDTTFPVEPLGLSPSADAVDPQASDPGTPSTRVKD
jgi:hypothetical protein